MKILIVKMSSLGDIIQSFPILLFLHKKFPEALIDWAVEESLIEIVKAHLFIRKAIPLSMRRLEKNFFQWQAWRALFDSVRMLRREKYDLIFDLQGNCKSGVVTMLSRGDTKVGFDLCSVREWPNVFATNQRFKVAQEGNIRLQHLSLLKQFFQDPLDEVEMEGVCFRVDEAQKKTVDVFFSLPGFKIMVCPGSKWKNKQIPVTTMVEFLLRIQKDRASSFLLIWGSDEEKKYCEAVNQQLPEHSFMVDRLELAVLQYLMHKMDLVIAVDSSALHLCATTSTPSFSIFGPTRAEVFKPVGKHHHAFIGTCPYGRSFEKTCPVLRTCRTGACMREISADDLFQKFLISRACSASTSS